MSGGQAPCLCAKGFHSPYFPFQPRTLAKSLNNRKDKTQLETLEIVKRIERRQLEHDNKVVGLDSRIVDLISGLGLDNGSSVKSPTQDSPASLPPSRPASTTKPIIKRLAATPVYGERHPSHHPNPTPAGLTHPFRHATAAHKMLTWPAVQELLRNKGILNEVDLQTLSDEGSAFMIQVCNGMPKLPLDGVVFEQPFMGMQSQATRQQGGARVTFMYLTNDEMDRLAKAYFNTYNLLYPFMDRDSFMSDILLKVKSEGFDSDTISVIALLVLALGEVALDSVETPSQFGLRGDGGGNSNSIGTIERRHPGIKLFNEARKRIGFVLTDCELENVQVFSLAA